MTKVVVGGSGTVAKRAVRRDDGGARSPSPPRAISPPAWPGDGGVVVQIKAGERQREPGADTGPVSAKRRGPRTGSLRMRTSWSRAWRLGGPDGCWQLAGRIVRTATSRARSLTGGPSGQPGLARGAWVSPTRQQAFYARDADQHPLRHRHGCCVRGDSGSAP
jgi:hypothetical protein